MPSSDLPPPGALSAASPRRPGPFAQLPPQARMTFVWAAPLMTLAFLVIANVAALPFMLPFIVMIGAGIGGGALESWMLAVAAVVSFAAFAGCALLWARIFERRRPATVGFTRSPFLYLRGLAGGFLLASGLTALGAAFAPGDVADALAGVGLIWSGGAGLVFLAGLFLIFVIQAGSEEVVCRGWMLSAITARRGPLVAVAVSSLGFAALHVHYLIFAPLTGALVIAGVALIGALLAFCALTERSIWGVCGVHCAYNYVLMVLAIGSALSENPEMSPLDVAIGALTNITSVTEYDPSLPGTILLLALLTLGFWAIWRRAAKKRDTALLAD